MKEINKDNNISLIVSGGAKGADTMGVQWANKNNIETKVFFPDFKKHKKWNGHSTGTKYTIDYARTLEKNLLVVKY